MALQFLPAVEIDVNEAEKLSKPEDFFLVNWARAKIVALATTLRIFGQNGC